MFLPIRGEIFCRFFFRNADLLLRKGLLSTMANLKISNFITIDSVVTVKCYNKRDATHGRE